MMHVVTMEINKIWILLITVDRENLVCLNFKIPHLF
jgi:hypothetical protein